MAHSLTWLPEVLKAAGLKVSTVDGWENRGARDVGAIFGVLCHHTGVNSSANMPTLNSLINGRKAERGLKALPGPLAQLGLARDGTYFVISAGKANHAGAGTWKGVVNGNSNFIGIEAENKGKNDPWPAVQLDAYHRGVAAILKHIGKDAGFCAGHKEYATPRGRKDDPDLDMVAFREAVATILNGTAPPPHLIPAAEPPAQPGGAPGRPTLRRNAKGDLVKQIQAKLGVDQVGNFGPKTEAAVRAFQRTRGLDPDGIVGPDTWAALDRA